MQGVCNVHIQRRLPFQRSRPSSVSHIKIDTTTRNHCTLKSRKRAVSASAASKVDQHQHSPANIASNPLRSAPTSLQLSKRNLRSTECLCSPDSGEHLSKRSSLNNSSGSDFNAQSSQDDDYDSTGPDDYQFGEEKSSGKRGKVGDVERLRLAEGIPMVAWYSRAPAGLWKSQAAESPTTMKMVSLVSIALLVNMTSMVFSLFFALVSADVVSMVKQSDPSGPIMLLVNFLFFGLGPRAFGQVYKSTVRALLAPVKDKYKDKILRMSKKGTGDVEKGVGDIIQGLTFEKVDAGTDADLQGQGPDDLDIDFDDFST